MKTSRRQFLKTSAALTAASSVTPSISIASEPQDHKALVIVFLFGGNDAYNTLIPLSQAGYETYKKVRPSLALSRNDVIDTGLRTENGEPLGIHKAMEKLVPFFKRGEASAIINSGQLIEPTKASDIKAKRVTLPDFLMAHNTQQAMWQTGASNLGLSLGWAGRVMDSLNPTSDLSPLFSVKGDSLLTRGDRLPQTIVSKSGVGEYEAWHQSALRDGYFEHFSDAGYSNLYSENYARKMRDSVLENESLREILQKHTVKGNYPQSDLGGQLAMVERLIDARHSLKQPRQVFFVGMGGFDTHHDQREKHPILLKQVSEALASFQESLVKLGISDQVITLTMSDFGRRAQANETGTDHGWGGHQFILGGAVKGGKAFGRWPDLSQGSESDYKNGRIIPGIASDQVNADLCSWLGVSSTIIQDIFPNLINFRDTPLSII
ncbi:hypothetical protein CS022_14805 [Veronia nyctiphanis]|uniref:DUF1501 domain-containing protein n=1 Tax=Veronia nyctiphanis TaxID=1278244 RepID=A0A4Q0YLX9_9GAMM|nr:DUF1501 domain-containing protein [Veronia nyctiphanis]RXJ71827.1 hypothetical protein CS022_19350 [Veronia nyctiphanis]RXJ72578.1 hypothetical protein CS022_14805 [Veronia nyctiphanis]